MSVGQDGRVTEFAEKPKEPKSNLAQQGFIFFNWRLLRKSLEDDRKNNLSSHDFGKDIIPKLLASKSSFIGILF